jgi:hypothetical protein
MIDQVPDRAVPSPNVARAPDRPGFFARLPLPGRTEALVLLAILFGNGNRGRRRGLIRGDAGWPAIVSERLGAELLPLHAVADGGYATPSLSTGATYWTLRRPRPSHPPT